jgi:hypothetical protein
MMHRTRTERVRFMQAVLALLALMLLAQSVAGAQTTYKIQPIVKLGDQVGDLTIRAEGGDFEIGTLNDNGQIVFITENANVDGSEMLFQYTDGKLIPLVAAGREAPGGRWSQAGGIYAPVSMNQLGNVVFATPVTVGDSTTPGTFLWDFKAQKTTAVALKGMPAANNLSFEAAGSFAPAINNRNEIALLGQVKNAEGKALDGLFFRGTDGTLRPVALPDQELPGGGKILSTLLPSLNDAGVIAFSVRRQGDADYSAYLWNNGTITPLAVVGSDAPDGRRFNGVAARVNNKNGNVLVVDGFANPPDPTRPGAIYLFAGGKLTPVLVPGQEMPGGGKFKSLPLSIYAVSFANDAGQHVILANLQDGATAAYLMQADGTLSLILKSGTTTDLGKITSIGGATSGVGFNNKGQVALVVQINEGLDTMVLLTP